MSRPEEPRSTSFPVPPNNSLVLGNETYSPVPVAIEVSSSRLTDIFRNVPDTILAKIARDEITDLGAGKSLACYK
jgi:hypothetical protein